MKANRAVFSEADYQQELETQSKKIGGLYFEYLGNYLKKKQKI